MREDHTEVVKGTNKEPKNSLILLSTINREEEYVIASVALFNLRDFKVLSSVYYTGRRNGFLWKSTIITKPRHSSLDAVEAP